MTTYKIAELPRRLNDIMDFDHVIRVGEDGTLDDRTEHVYAPESVIETSHDGQVSAEDEAAWTRRVRAEGWEPERGWTGQYGYSGPFMHASEYVGGALADHVLETPGLWVVVVVGCLPDPDPDPRDGDHDPDDCETCERAGCGDIEPAGWAILHMDDTSETDSYVVTLDPRQVTAQASHIRELPRMTLAGARQEVTTRWIGGHPSLGRIVRVTDLAVMPAS